MFLCCFFVVVCGLSSRYLNDDFDSCYRYEDYVLERMGVLNDRSWISEERRREVEKVVDG
jgi:hypothetical protein